MAIKKMLFPTDFSTNSETAFNYVVNLAGILNSEVILFHCYGYPPVVTDVPLEGLEEQIRSIEKDTRKKIEELIEYGRKVNPNVLFNSIILHGDFTTLITEIIKENEIDLVTMSTKGAGPLKALLVGSNAAKVIEKSPCPVFVIPEFQSYESIKHILFPSEFFDSDIKNISFLTEIAKPFEAIITILNIAEEDYILSKMIAKKFEKEVRKTIPYPNLRFDCIDSKNVETSIAEFTNQNNMNLIVMSTRHRNKFERLYDHSLTKKMAYKTYIPLLAFHVEEIFEEQTKQKL